MVKYLPFAQKSRNIYFWDKSLKIFKKIFYIFLNICGCPDYLVCCCVDNCSDLFIFIQIPICVQDEFGVQQTAVFILIHLISQKVEMEGLNIELDMQHFIAVLRTQRREMLIDIDELKFVYEALNEYVALKKNKAHAMNI